VGVVFSAVRLVNSYSDRFDEMERRVDVLYKELKKRVDGLLMDLAAEVEEATGFAIEIGSLDIDLRTTVSVLERMGESYYRRAKAILDEFPEYFLRELGRSIRLSARSFEEKIDVVLKIMHILYLAGGREDVYHLNVLLYAYKLAYKSRIRFASLFVLTGIARFLKTKDYVLAHALAAYGVRDVLPLRDRLVEEVWENPGVWSTVLQLSYDYEVGSLVNGELLVAWGFLEAISEEEAL